MTLPLLLSKREAARLLGVGRGATLQGLIESGKLRVVKVAGRVRVPREEVERVAREGTEPAPAFGRCRRVVSRGQSEAAKVLALKF